MYIIELISFWVVGLLINNNNSVILQIEGLGTLKCMKDVTFTLEVVLIDWFEWMMVDYAYLHCILVSDIPLLLLSLANGKKILLLPAKCGLGRVK